MARRKYNPTPKHDRIIRHPIRTVRPIYFRLNQEVCTIYENSVNIIGATPDHAILAGFKSGRITHGTEALPWSQLILPDELFVAPKGADVHAIPRGELDDRLAMVAAELCRLHAFRTRSDQPWNLHYMQDAALSLCDELFGTHDGDEGGDE